MRELSWLLDQVVIPRRKVFHVKHIFAIRETIFGDYILSQC